MFDYGVEEELLKGTPGHNIKHWPTEGELTALVDADTIPYIVGFTSTVQEYLKFKNSPDPYKSDVWLDKIDHANYILNTWIEQAGCDSAILFLTNSEDNFRLEIGTVKEYKGQRREEKPPFFSELKTWIEMEHKAVMSKRCEADDEISIEAWSRHRAWAKENKAANLWKPEHKASCNFVIISKDKDLKIIPGMHLPPDMERPVKMWVRPIGWLEPKYQESEVKAYENWPLFDGKPVNLKHLIAFISSAGVMGAVSSDKLKKDTPGWEENHIWYLLDDKAKPVKQDIFTRGTSKGKGKFKRVQVGTTKKQNIQKLTGAGLLFFYSQLITGDGVDNYPGLPGHGPVKAYEALAGLRRERDLCMKVAKMYISHYGDPGIARSAMLEQARLAHMQTHPGELWKFPSDQRGTFPAWAWGPNDYEDE